jgi:hypothetical protein
MNQDTIKFKIEEDGTISITTDEVSGTNHMSADKLLKRIFELAGGDHTTTKRNRLNVGVGLHEALHNHAADGHTH